MLHATRLGQTSGRFSGLLYSKTFSTGALIVIDDFMFAFFFTLLSYFIVTVALADVNFADNKKSHQIYFGGLHVWIDVNPPSVI